MHSTKEDKHRGVRSAGQESCSLMQGGKEDLFEEVTWEQRQGIMV